MPLTVARGRPDGSCVHHDGWAPFVRDKRDGLGETGVLFVSLWRASDCWWWERIGGDRDRDRDWDWDWFSSKASRGWGGGLAGWLLAGWLTFEMECHGLADGGPGPPIRLFGLLALPGGDDEDGMGLAGEQKRGKQTTGLQRRTEQQAVSSRCEMDQP